MGKKKTIIINEETREKTVIIDGIFQIVLVNSNYRIAVADKLVSKMTFATVEEATKYINSKPWDLIINVSCLCYDMSMKENN